MKMKLNVHHDKKHYAKGSEAPKELEQLFKEKGFVEVPEQKEQSKADDKKQDKGSKSEA